MVLLDWEIDLSLGNYIFVGCSGWSGRNVALSVWKAISEGKKGVETDLKYFKKSYVFLLIGF